MKLKRFTAVCITSAVLLAAVFGLNTSAIAQTGNGQDTAESTQDTGGATAQKSKDEVVYATLGQSGSVDSIYVVNHFSSAEGEKITDYGAYDSVLNLTNTDELGTSGDAVSFTPKEENFYYQGNMSSKDLPWSFKFAYFLDGKETSPQDIAGKSGKLELKISSSQNPSVDSTFYDNYMLQISVTLDTEKCFNIEAPDSTLASAGKDKSISFTVLPGGDADYSLTADVQDFTMAGITVAAVPYSMSMDFPDMEDSLGDLEQLPDAISELNEGVGELNEGTSEMKDGTSELAGGSAEIKSGLARLGGNSGKITSGSTQINGALQKIAAELGQNDLGELNLSQISNLPAGLSALSGGLRELSAGLSELKAGFVPAYQILDTAIQGIPSVNITQDQINAIYAATGINSTVDDLIAQYKAAQTVKGTYMQVKAAFDGVGTAIDKATATIGTMADSLDASAAQIGSQLEKLSGLEDLEDLMSGLAELAANYAEFHDGLVKYADGVSALSTNYAKFHAGIVSLDDGVGDLSSGIDELYDGTATMNEEMADLPDMIQDEIDAMKEDYLPTAFEPISFTSPKNTDTGFVQFVIQSEGIEAPEPEEDAPSDEEEEQDETFWDRLVALFKGDGK